MSGVLASPAPSRMSSRQEQHLSVPGVGEVPTVWIGQEGRRRIGRLLEHEELLPVVKGLKDDLSNLACICLKAFTKLDAESSSDGDVKAAVELCTQFAPTKPVHAGCKATRITELWKTQPSVAPNHTTSTEQRACEAVGEKLVEVITERNKQPPDVSQYCINFLQKSYPFVSVRHF